METKTVLTQVDVDRILKAASEHACARGWNVTISVVDDGGHLLGLKRLDGAAPMTAMISPGKARAAALGRRESGRFEESINGGRFAYLSVPVPVLLEGGLPIVVNEQVVGGIGVSGVQSTQDVEICRAGLATLSEA